jgi:anti-sigma28 factor (negative regulator of flagellin synthesis)
MSSINPISSSSPVYRNTELSRATAAPVSASSRPTDRVEISGFSQFLSALKTNEVRADKVSEIKAQLADGSFNEDAKLDATVDILLDELA